MLVEAEFEILSLQDSSAYLKLNITNTGINRCIVNGTYFVVAVSGTDRYSVAGYEGASEKLASWGRHFLYGSNKGIYSVTFLMDEFSETPILQLLVYNATTRQIGNIPPLAQGVPTKKKNLFQKAFPAVSLTKWKNKIKRNLKNQKLKLGRALYRYINACHRNFRFGKKKRVLFLSEQDDSLALNMQIVHDRMLERGLQSQFYIDQSLRKRTTEEQSIFSEIRNLLKIARADILILDDHVPTLDKVKLYPSVVVIQLWHAGAGYKGVGYSRWGHQGCPGPYSCHRQYTYCISGSSNISGFFSEQFGILDEQIIPTGMPRFDLFCNQENRDKLTKTLYANYPQLNGKFVALFAPTYRGRGRKTAYYPYDKLDFDQLADYCKQKNAVILFKMHPWVTQPVPIPEQYSDCMLDMNTYGNINDLFYVTDLLITDYSSCIYEFSLMRKPMLFFAYDKTQYSTSRGFHRNYDQTIPGKLCEDFESLLNAMRNEDYEFEKASRYVEDHFDQVDDKNADRVIDWLILGKLPEKYKKALEVKKAHVQKTRGLSLEEFLKEDPDSDEL